MPDRVGAVGGPDAATFPAGARVGDSSVHAARVEAQWVGYAHDHIGFIVWDEREQRIGRATCGDGYVVAESERVVLIHPAVIVEVGTAMAGHPFHLGAWRRIE